MSPLSQYVITSTPTAGAAAMTAAGLVWGPEDFGVESFDAYDIAALTGKGDPDDPGVSDACERLGVSFGGHWRRSEDARP